VQDMKRRLGVRDIRLPDAKVRVDQTPGIDPMRGGGDDGDPTKTTLSTHLQQRNSRDVELALQNMRIDESEQQEQAREGKRLEAVSTMPLPMAGTVS